MVGAPRPHAPRQGMHPCTCALLGGWGHSTPAESPMFGASEGEALGAKAKRYGLRTRCHSVSSCFSEVRRGGVSPGQKAAKRRHSTAQR